MTILLAVLGLALLMVVHEGGHHLVARAFGMRVLKFSIGFGPPLWRYQSKSGTVYQVALIPMLAYVQIDGMNPLEEVDPTDQGSYANASLLGRMSAIVAGPLANYLFASLPFFAAFMLGGKPIGVTTEVDAVTAQGAASTAGMRPGDKVLEIDGRAVANDWKQLVETVQQSPGQPLEFTVQRPSGTIKLQITPANRQGKGRIGMRPVELREPFAVGEAAQSAATHPAEVIAGMVLGLAQIVSCQQQAQVAGPLEIGNQIKQAAEHGADRYFYLLGILSTWLALLNMFPFPALDGGRLVFLIYEAISRRRANAKIEATIHALGLLLLLGLVSIVSMREVNNYLSADDEEKPSTSGSPPARQKPPEITQPAAPAPAAPAAPAAPP